MLQLKVGSPIFYKEIFPFNKNKQKDQIQKDLNNSYLFYLPKKNSLSNLHIQISINLELEKVQYNLNK